MTDTFNEQQVLYTWEREFCERALPFLYALGARRIGKSQLHREGREAALPHEWALGWKKGGSKRHRTRIEFKGVDYVDGDDVAGTPIVYDLEGEGRNWSQLYPSQAVGVRQVIEDSITLRDESWDEYNVNASFSVTNRQSISAGASVGPAEAKAEASSEQTASTSFGKTGGGRKVVERTQSIRTELDIPAGAKDILASSNIGKRKEVTPVIENGYIEADIEINLDDWSEENAPWLRDGKDEKRNVIRCATIQDLLWFIEGQRLAEYPNMRGFLDKMRRSGGWAAPGTVDFHEWLKNVENRRVSLSKNRVRVYESAGTVETRFVD